ncbi:zinc finger and BTB domain-containing protein 17-like isoform X1 [Neocloeon triangulifer]|uniref:zinc finger and BTB domain-containing protein 17-like isoform X1 n=1 Tax=Neocloeon triangulifer TaxID=2078957 RepID=UPI00286F2429|nr:zinc finger and BTB domain-containing protein 17-like isoform X1 [Neocloeon triangulifer]
MASQQYSLRWNNYVRHMTSAFESLRSDRDLIDVTLSCEGKKIPAHKMLLSACSSYFKDLFKENPCQHPVIIFRNVTFDDLMALVDFMYNGEVNVEQEQLASFLNTAELLQVQGLTNSSKDQEKVKKTAKEDERVPASGSHFEEDVEERTSTPTRSGPPAAKKRKWQSPNRTESPAAVLESQTAQGSADGDEDVQSIEQVPLKTETPDYDEDEDIQAGSGVDDTADEQDIVQKLQKSDQLVLTSNRNRTSNNEHSLFGNNSVDMDSGDMSSFGMAGPSNESMGQEGMQDFIGFYEDFSKDFAHFGRHENECWQIENAFSIPSHQFEMVHTRKVRRRRIFTVTKQVKKLVANTSHFDQITLKNGDNCEYFWESGRPRRSVSLGQPEKLQPVVDLGPRVKITGKEDALKVDENVPKKRGRKPKVKEIQKKKPGPKPKIKTEFPDTDQKLAIEKIERKKPGPKPKVKIQNESDVKCHMSPENKKSSPEPAYLGRAEIGKLRDVLRLRVVVRDGNFLCNKCGREFAKKRHCLMHQNTHRFKFCCHRCKRNFSSKGRLAYHKRSICQINKKSEKIKEIEKQTA